MRLIKVFFVQMPAFLTEKFSKILLYVGIALFIFGAFLFVWNQSMFSLASNIDPTRFAEFGDLIGGVVGSLWSLAGVILFYIALKAQQKDIQINQEALNTQNEALKKQIEEFQLQKVELQETREVFKEQSETLRIQRFESTFFQLLSLHQGIIESLQHPFLFNSNQEKVAKKELLNRAVLELHIAIHKMFGDENRTLKEEFFKEKELHEIHVLIQKAYIVMCEDVMQGALSQYFNNLYYVFYYLFISRYINNYQRSFYASIAISQLSSNELFLLYYHSMCEELGYPKLHFLVHNFDICRSLSKSMIYNNIRHDEVFLNLYDKSIEDELKKQQPVGI